MKGIWKKVIAFGMAAVLTASSMPSLVLAKSTSDVVTPDNPAFFRNMTSDEMIEEMGIGINLGNTLEGHSNYTPGETLWNSVVTTKSLIKAMHDLGYNTLRIPVTWGNMINEDYSVDEMWMSRVQDVVDYAIAENMYVMINIHHDGATETKGWLNIGGSDEEFAKVQEKFNGLWKTIAERFKNYDEHLIFESMNEVYEEGLGWSDKEAEVNRELARINQLNQSFVDVVRATGSNNTQRWLSVPTKNTQIKTMIEERFQFEVPSDSAGHIMVAAHSYDPWSGSSTDENEKDSYAYQFKALKEKYVDKGIPVVIGEFGTLSGRVPLRLCEGMGYLLKKYRLIGCLWDVDSENCLIDRKNETTRYKDFTDAMMRGYFYDTSADQIVSEPEIKELTGFEIDPSQITMQVNEKKKIIVSDILPADSNDIVLWKSSDAEIASVYNGMIAARAIGTVTITAFSQSGTVVKEISVTVSPEILGIPSIGIDTDADAFEVEQGEGIFINAFVLPAGNQATVSYRSSDVSIATVSTMGRVDGIKKGKAVITVTTSDGVSREIPVEVVEPKTSDTLDSRLAIHILYQDKLHNYSDTEVGGDIVRATGDGRYTLKFDCASDLSQQAKDAGVSTLNYLGALYIRDYDVTMGTKRQSTKKEGKIQYNSIKINGNEMLAGDTEEYKAVKSGIFDTGNPFNIWDGSVTSTGITENKKDYNITFDSIENPTMIEITFTLKGFSPEESLPTPENSSTPVAPVQTEAPKTEEATIKVTKLKAQKKKVVVKKGKKKKVTFSVTTSNGKKVDIGSIKVKTGNKKIAKVEKITMKPKKIVVSVKGVKKGKKTVLTVSAGKKSAKTTIQVK